MKILLDRAKCTAIGMCESVDPDRFEIDADGELIVHSEEISLDQLSSAQEAILACPTAALRLSED